VRWRGSWPGSATSDNHIPAGRGCRRYGAGRIGDITREARGNTTGISILGTKPDGKRQEILFEAVPGISHLAALSDPSSSTIPRLRALEEGARARGIKLSIQQVTRPEEIADAIATVKATGAEALNVLASALPKLLWGLPGKVWMDLGING
jgi:hypothetical protein